MSMDYSSSANTFLGRAKPVAVIGTVTVSGTSATPASATVTGTTPFRGNPTNASMAIKGSAGRVYGVIASNPGAAACWVNVYNIVTATVGTTVPVLQLLVPPGGTVEVENSVPMTFGTGICISATDVSSVLSAVAPATLPIVNVQYL